MYINKYIFVLFILIISFNGCSNPEIASNSIKYFDYTSYLDGNIRAFDVINDTLFVATENHGIVVYKIQQEGGKISLDSLASNNLITNPVTLEIAPKSRSIIVLSDYNYNYIGKLDNLSTMSGITCDTYQRKSTFIEYEDSTINLITPFRHKATQNEVDLLAWNTSFIHKIKFPQEEYNLGFYFGDCSDTLYKYLNYDIEDVYYNDGKLYLTNAEDSITSNIVLDYDMSGFNFSGQLYDDERMYNDERPTNSVIILNHDISDDSFSPIDTIKYLPSVPLTVKSNSQYIYIGLDDDEGCYIKLLDSNNENNSNFTIASGYDIQDIQLSNNYVALSAGYGGSLIYNSNIELLFILENIYAYKTLVYDDSNIIVGTKNGLYIYQTER